MYGEVDIVFCCRRGLGDLASTMSCSEFDKVSRRTEMETVRIGVLISDVEYRNALLRGLSHESRDFQFIALDSNCKSFDSCQVMLTDMGSGQCHMVIHLTYHEMYDMSALQNRMEIFRYEDARVFIGKIIYYYAKAKGIDLYFHGKRKCRKIVFSSLRGGVGTTSAAVTAARFLKYRFDKKTLFISLCPLDGSREFTGASDGGNMLSLLYHLQAGDDVPLCKFISSSDGVDHIRGQTNNRAASEMSCTELKKLLKMIDIAGCYDYLIVDLGTNWGHLSEYIIDRADVVVVMRSEKENGNGFPLGGSIMGDDKNGSKVIKVTEYDNSAGPYDMEYRVSGNNDGMAVKYDPGAFIHEKDRTYIDMRSMYGHDVSMLAEKIMERAD